MSDTTTTPEVTPFTEFELGKFYQDELGSDINGTCTSISFHLSGCTSINVFQDKKGGRNYMITATRVRGFEGDATAHSDEAKKYLGARVKHTHLELSGVVVVYEHSKYGVDAVAVQYVDRNGIKETTWIDMNLVKFLDAAPASPAVVHEPGKKVGAERGLPARGL